MPVNLEQNHPPSGPVSAAQQDVDRASNNNERTGRQRKPAQEEDEVAAPKSVFAKFFNRKGTQKQTKTKETKSTSDKVREVKVPS